MRKLNLNLGTRVGIKTLLKILVFLVLIVGLFFYSDLIIYLSSLQGNRIGYYSGYLLKILGISLLIFSFWVQCRFKVHLWVGLLILYFIPGIIRDVYVSYDSRFTRIREDLKVSEYQPFIKGTKAVYLRETSTLSLKEPLPILDGTRVLYPLYSAFSQAVFPNKDYFLSHGEVTYNNTLSAYKRLINRYADIIFVVFPSEEQVIAAHDAGVKIQLTAIAQDALVFFVNKKNPINNLSSEQLQDIYSGRIKNWREVGGNNQSIKAFQRNIDMPRGDKFQGSGSQSAFLSFMKGNQVINAPTIDVGSKNGRIYTRSADYVNYPNSLGFTFNFFIQQLIVSDEIKVLSIDGVYPSKETIKSGDYPLRVLFYAATLENNNDDEVERMIRWILSPQGQQVVEEAGYVRIN